MRGKEGDSSSKEAHGPEFLGWSGAQASPAHAGRGILRVHSKRSHFVVGRGVEFADAARRGSAKDEKGGIDDLTKSMEARRARDGDDDGDENLLEAVMNGLASGKPVARLYD